MQQQVQGSRVFPDGDCEVFVRRESACSGDCHKCSGCGAQAQQVLMLLGYFAGLALKLSAGVLAGAGFALGVAAIVAYDRLIARRRGVTYVVTAFAEN